MLRWLARDFNSQLNPELRRLARPGETSTVADIAPDLERLEETDGRVRLRLDVSAGSWAFLRSLTGSTPAQFRRTLGYMILSELSVAGPPLLVEQYIRRFDALRAAPLAPANLALILALPAVLFFTNFTFRRYMRGFAEASVLQRSGLISEFLGKWFRLRPQSKREISQGNVQSLLR